MPSNTKQYAKEYRKKRRRQLIKKLGGRCERCGITQDLIIHRIYSMMNTRALKDNKQEMFNLSSVNQSKKLFMTKEERVKRRKDLRDNPDNMILLCYNCWRVLEREYGRNRKIGRLEIREALRG